MFLRRVVASVLVFVLVFSAAGAAFAGDGKPCKDVVRELKEFKSNYLLWVPKNYKKDNPRTVVVFMPNVMYDYKTYVPMWQDVVEMQGIIYCVAKCPSGQWSAKDDKFILGILDDVKTDYAYDPQSVLLVGNAEAAVAAISIGTSHPDRFTAACGVAGIYTSAKDLKAPTIKNIPIYIEHGGKSTDFAISTLKNLIKDMEKLGAKVHLEERPDAVDTIPLAGAKSNPDLLAWFRDQKAGDSKKNYEDAVAAKTANDFPKAIGLFNKILSAGGKGPYIDGSKKELADLQNKAKIALGEAENLVKAEKLSEAIKKYNAVVKEYAGLDEAKKAAEALDALKKSGKVEKAGDQAKKDDAEAAADKAYRAAAEKETAKDFAGAMRGYEEVANKYKDTTAGAKAAAAFARLKSDPEIAKTAAADDAKKDRDGLAKKAENYRKNGLIDKAIEVWKQLVDKYPDTDEGKTAKEMLDKYKK